jgi:hypothetical protein
MNVVMNAISSREAQSAIARHVYRGFVTLVCYQKELLLK